MCPFCFQVVHKSNTLLNYIYINLYADTLLGTENVGVLPQKPTNINLPVRQSLNEEVIQHLVRLRIPVGGLGTQVGWLSLYNTPV